MKRFRINRKIDFLVLLPLVFGIAFFLLGVKSIIFSSLGVGTVFFLAAGVFGIYFGLFAQDGTGSIGLLKIEEVPEWVAKGQNKEK